jgi:hypothetical protein
MKSLRALLCDSDNATLHINDLQDAGNERAKSLN